MIAECADYFLERYNSTCAHGRSILIIHTFACGSTTSKRSMKHQCRHAFAIFADHACFTNSEARHRYSCAYHCSIRSVSTASAHSLEPFAQMLYCPYGRLPNTGGLAAKMTAHTLSHILCNVEAGHAQGLCMKTEATVAS